MSQAIIETNNLSVNYGQYRGIHELNLIVEEGEVYGFLGPNGAKKPQPSAFYSTSSARPPDAQSSLVSIARRMAYKSAGESATSPVNSSSTSNCALMSIST